MPRQKLTRHPKKRSQSQRWHSLVNPQRFYPTPFAILRRRRESTHAFGSYPGAMHIAWLLGQLQTFEIPPQVYGVKPSQEIHRCGGINRENRTYQLFTSQHNQDTPLSFKELRQPSPSMGSRQIERETGRPGTSNLIRRVGVTHLLWATFLSKFQAIFALRSTRILNLPPTRSFIGVVSKKNDDITNHGPYIIRHTTQGAKMLRTYHTLILALTLTFFALTVIGCSSPARVDQGKTNRIPTDSRGPVDHGQLGSKELENTTDMMLESIVASIDNLKRGPDGRTIIIVDRIINKSMIPTQDTEIFLMQLRRKLNNSGIKHDIVFVANPNAAAAARDRVLEEPLKYDYEIPGARPNYALTGKLYALEETGARYWEMFFSLLDLDPDNIIRNEIRWENSAAYRFAR